MFTCLMTLAQKTFGRYQLSWNQDLLAFFTLFAGLFKIGFLKEVLCLILV